MARSTGDLVASFGVNATQTEELVASYNVAPTDEVPLIVDRFEKKGHKAASGAVARQLLTARWGLVPSWSKDPKAGARLINARRETVTGKPSFRKAAANRRALVPADGYYEWQKTADGRIPHYLHGETNEPLAFAGLYEYWPDPSLSDDHPDKWLRTCTIITAAATDALGHIHDRTPVIVPPDLYADWLDPGTTSPAQVQQLLDSMPEPRLVPRIVSTKANSVRNNGPELIEPAEG